MAYLVLARKYRPQLFSDVAGQDHVTRTLLNALSQKRIAHGYIFSGHRGIGKTTIARILAMALNCRTEIGTPATAESPGRPTPEPCGFCESCVEVRAGNSTDVLEIDAATNRGIDEIRELREAARYRPSRDRYKIYILDEAHQITDAAFNALLKTLEEPPDHVIFMMATTQPEDIPQTIRSRCQHFSFHAVSFDAIVNQLTGIAASEGILVDDETLGLLAEAGDGSMRDALSIMDQAIASAPVGADAAGGDGKPQLSAEQIRDLMGNVPSNVFEQLLEAVSANDSRALLLDVNRLLNAGHSAQQLARQMVHYLRNCLMVKVAGDATDLLQVSADERKRAARSAMLFGEEDLTRFLQIMLRTFDDLGYRQEQRLHFELGLLKLVHAQRLLPLEQMLSPVAGLSKSAPPSQRSLPPLQPARTSAPAVAPVERNSLPSGLAAGQASDQSETSPFARDSRRKEPSASGSTAPASTTPRIEGALALAPANDLAPETASASQTVPDSVAPGAARFQVTSLPVTEETVAETPVAVQPVDSPSVVMSADAVQAAVMQALVNAGQNSAAQLLSQAVWAAGDAEWKVTLTVTDAMLSVGINQEARKLAERTLRENDVKPSKIVYLASGAGKPATAAAPLPLPAGGVRQLAQENALVQRAKDLFQAEIRDVVDLRERGR